MATLSTDTNSEYRLPTDVSPIHYDLIVLTDLEGLKFVGTVEIDLAIRNTTTRIVLNVADLELQDVSVSLEDGQALVPLSEAMDKLSERVTLIFPVALAAGSTAKLFIAFTGVLTGSMVGYYRSLTTGPDEDQKYCALTQFEAGVKLLLWRTLYLIGIHSLLADSRQARVSLLG